MDTETQGIFDVSRSFVICAMFLTLSSYSQPFLNIKHEPPESIFDVTETEILEDFPEDFLNKERKPKIISSIQSFCCDLCDKTYSTKVGLKVHVKIKHVEPYKNKSCILCQKEVHNLSYHLNTFHSGENFSSSFKFSIVICLFIRCVFQL
jgi:hypothetical protein